jgi:DNA-binding PucR family transcriptional regulator/putative methionine-R-sulfoxide reductase with GAF domain
MNPRTLVATTPARRGGRAAREVAPDIPADAFEALLEIGHAVQAEEIELEQVLSLVVRRTSQLLQADLAWVALLDRRAARVHVVESWGARGTDFDDMAVTMGAGLGGVALRENETIVVEDYAEYTAGTPEVVHNTMLNEGVVSVMCAPMLRGPNMVGALYAANRRRTHFRPEHVSLLSTIATQVSSAIRHAQMYHELELRNDLLERSFGVHRELSAIGLREAGLHGIAAALARVVGARIVVEQEVVAPFRQEHGPPEAVDPAAEPLVVPIAAGDRQLGQIAIATPELSELQILALDHGATVIALELLKQRAARDVELRLRGELLEELLETSGSIPVTVVERAERLEVDIHTPRRILALEAQGGSIDYGELLAIVRAKAGRQLHGIEAPVLAVKRGGKVMLAMCEVEARVETAIVDDIRKAVAGRGATLWVGISRLAEDFSAAQREAIACLRLAQASSGSESVVRSSDLGALRFVLGSNDLQHANEMVLAQLQPLIAHDADSKSPLLPTLRAYLEADGHQPTVAAACFIHISTLKYRLKKIRELLDGDLSDPETAFQLRLAFKLMDLLGALGVETPGHGSQQPAETPDPRRAS